MEKPRSKGVGNLVDDKTKISKAGKAILLVVQFIIGCFAIMLGCVLLLFDGFCAGGYFCSKQPGIIAFFGALLVVFSVSQFFFTLRRFKAKRQFILVITLVVATLLYCMRLLLYFSRH